jgi:uncharacterized protein
MTTTDAHTRGAMRGDELRVQAAPALRATTGAAGAGATVSGYAAVFGVLSEDLGGFREQIAPGAFKKTIRESDVRLLWNHSDGEVLGRSRPGKSSTLTLAEDASGLLFECPLPDTHRGRDVPELVRRGDVDQCSFGFLTIRDVWEYLENGDVIRTLLEVRLFDVSLVTFPAYAETSADVRARAGHERTMHTPDETYRDRLRRRRLGGLVHPA